MNIVGIAGSPTSPSRSTALLRAALASLARPQGPGTIEIEVRLLPAVPLLAADARDPLIAQALAQVAAADVVLVATPIYKAAYSGALKAFLDLLPQDGLRGKTVLALGTGGSIGHLLALDYALKPVLSALGARHVLDVVYAEDTQFERDHALQRHIPSEAVLDRLGRALAPLQPPLRVQPAALAALAAVPQH
ncbi:NADPH-dependent FMN reductase [Ideonella azotifigens]|uniref:NADPH-dependent FMN reductase n=2 Tax=Ideonella azotifigens TaxID=513160 RepID=A0ABP3UZE6_9BURK|nr:NADPH-dependent FMN reductase [Ideonella azotifigens]MCD2339921.1 NADPH-dependent FMN reductase [Ideonella azotifigens]